MGAVLRQDRPRGHAPHPTGEIPDFAQYQAARQEQIRRHLVTWGAVVLAVVYSLWATNFGIWSLITGLYESFRFVFVDAMPPRLEGATQYIGPTLETLYMSVFGLVMSVVLSVPVGILAARNTTPHPTVSFLAKAVAGFARAVPSLIMAIFLVAILGIGPLAGALALGIGGVGILGKAYGDAIEEIDMNQIEGLRSTGGSWLQILGQGVWPQVKPAFVTWSLYRLERNVRGGAVLGLVGAGGLGFHLLSAINLYRFRTASMIILWIFIAILAIEYITGVIRRRAI